MAFASTLTAGAAANPGPLPMTKIQTAIRGTQANGFLKDASATKVLCLLLASRTVVSQCVLMCPNPHASPPGRNQRSLRIDSGLFQNPSPKCIANVTGLVAGPPVGRLNRTGKSASTKYALKNPLSVWIGQLLFTSGVKPNWDELTSNAARTPTPMSCPTLQTTPG